MLQKCADLENTRPKSSSRSASKAATADIIGLLGSKQTTHKVIRNLVRKGWLARLIGGRYMLLPPERGAENIGENNPLAIASAVVEKSFVGWWSAAAFHSFTTQKPATVTVAVLRQMAARIIEGTDIKFIKVEPRKFFGFRPYSVYGRQAVISEPEKQSSTVSTTLTSPAGRPNWSALSTRRWRGSKWINSPSQCFR